MLNFLIISFSILLYFKWPSINILMGKKVFNLIFITLLPYRLNILIFHQVIHKVISVKISILKTISETFYPFLLFVSLRLALFLLSEFANVLFVCCWYWFCNWHLFSLCFIWNNRLPFSFERPSGSLSWSLLYWGGHIRAIILSKIMIKLIRAGDLKMILL